ncbi:MAG TPA: c-type cytochrome [Gammaproteobacteria bacterium]
MVAIVRWTRDGLAALGMALLLGGCGEQEQAPPQQSTAAKADEVIGDIAVGKQLAKSCAECHGYDGIKGKEGAPFIAGLPQQYLIRSMLAYDNGSRTATMLHARMEKLEPQQMGDVSAYFASLKTLWQGGAVPRHQPLVYNREAIARGKAAATSCDTCHGGQHKISKADVPNLPGMQPAYFLKALDAYFSGSRNNRFMNLLKPSLKGVNVNDLAAYYAAQQPVKAPPPSFGNSARGQTKSWRCAGCHGRDGNSPNPAVPSLAGQPAEFLRIAQLEYLAGTRKSSVMQTAMRGVGVSEVADISAWYAAQTPNVSLFYTGGHSRRFDPIRDGERIASACDGCHGHEGNSVRPGFPSLTGLHVKYLTGATLAYRNGARHNAMMRTMIDFLDEDAAEKVAFYYATREPRRDAQRTPGGEVAKGKKVAEGCTSCHGENGVSKEPLNPSLAGQDAQYLASATREYARGIRKHEGMLNATEKLTPEEIRDVAAFFATQTPQRPANVYAPEEAQVVIEKRCNHCHDRGGFGSEFDKPRIAGQSERYLVAAMKAYASNERRHSAMNAMADVLSGIEIREIAAYYARQKDTHQGEGK